MTGMKTTKQALDEAIGIAGGLASFVQKVGAPSVNAVKGWKHTGSIPADYCPQIERATGVSCEYLRPSVDWSYLRATDCGSGPNQAPAPAQQAQAAIKTVAQGAAT